MHRRAIFFLAYFIREFHCGEYTVFTAGFASYSNAIRPGSLNSSINATVHINRFRLIDVIEVEQSIQFFIEVRLSWIDPVIRWNPLEDKANTSSIKVPEDTVWLPDISIFSSVSKIFPVPSFRRVIKVDHKGVVVMRTPQIIFNPCQLSVEKFPFDRQSCVFRIGPWAYESKEVGLRPLTLDSLDISNTDLFRGTSEWNLEAIDVAQYADDSYGDGNIYDEVHYTIHLKRKWNHYFWVFILPTFICASLCLFGLFMPSESAGYRFEKVSLGVTTLLSMTMVLESFTSNMPKSANLPLLGVYVLAEELVCTFATIVTCLFSLLHERATTRKWLPPGWLSKILLFKEYDARIRNRTTSIQPDVMSPSPLYRQLRLISTHLIDITSDAAIAAQWMRIFDRLDICAMILFQVINFTMTMVILVGRS